ncbi:hypothetical protein GH733_008444 [Mirounga leonina]|nr:hypothetical protein GH733_008444 [Mirounga leonina]
MSFHLHASCGHEGKNEILKDHSGLLQRPQPTPNERPLDQHPSLHYEVSMNYSPDSTIFLIHIIVAHEPKRLWSFSLSSC